MYEFITNLISNLTTEILVQIIIFGISSGAVMSIIFGIPLRYVPKEIGLIRIHIHGRNMKSLKKALLKAESIHILASTGRNFIYENRDLLEKAISNSTNIEALIASPNSAYLSDICTLENLNIDILNKEIEETKQLLVEMDKRAEKTYSRIEVRCFSSELRTPMIICRDKNGIISAWVTLYLPTNRPAECISLEFKRGYADKCYQSFLTIWSAYSKNSILSINHYTNLSYTRESDSKENSDSI